MLTSFAAAWLLCVGLCEGVVPPYQHPVLQSAVSWTDANWKGELGTMPLGNGDVAVNVWVEKATGDLLVYMAKSDAFDMQVNRSEYLAHPHYLPAKICQRRTHSKSAAFAYRSLRRFGGAD
jgi:hypothetical protein